MLGLSTLQAKLAIKQDNLRRKIIDNSNIRNISTPVDCIRMHTKKSYEGDDLYWDIEKTDVISAAFPALTDVPFRKIKVDEKTHLWQLTSLVNSFDEENSEKVYKLSVPYNYDIDVGDMIFRIFIDEDIKYPIIIAMQVTELLGSFGGKKLIMQNVQCTIPTVTFPKEVIDTISKMAERRMRIGF
jgi:hypothetical protein